MSEDEKAEPEREPKRPRTQPEAEAANPRALTSESDDDALPSRFVCRAVQGWIFCPDPDGRPKSSWTQSRAR